MKFPSYQSLHLKMSRFLVCCLPSLIFNVVATARIHPELIVFLDLFELVKQYRNDFHGFKRAPVAAVTCDSSAQTELHPIASNYDNSYVWNVWDYRRKAIQLANLLQMKTTSAQTAVVYQRYGVETQTWDPRDSGAQTRKDATTNAPLPQRFVRGLRGSDAKLSRDVKLTEYVDDDVHTQTEPIPLGYVQTIELVVPEPKPRLAKRPKPIVERGHPCLPKPIEPIDCAKVKTPVYTSQLN